MWQIMIHYAGNVLVVHGSRPGNRELRTHSAIEKSEIWETFFLEQKKIFS